MEDKKRTLHKFREIQKRKKNERTGHTAGYDPKFSSKRKNKAAGGSQRRVKDAMHGSAPLKTLNEEDEEEDEEYEDEFQFHANMADTDTPL